MLIDGVSILTREELLNFVFPLNRSKLYSDTELVIRERIILKKMRAFEMVTASTIH